MFYACHLIYIVVNYGSEFLENAPNVSIIDVDSMRFLFIIFSINWMLEM